MRPPGPLLASGRDSDIFEYGPGLVLRRARERRSMVDEARTMQHARRHGYPVPAVEEISDDGTELVMERVDGVSMAAALTRRPWTLRQAGALLADLHVRLHQIPAPEWLPPAPFGHGDRLLHLDLHPLNVLITAEGPVVIDWPNAARGEGASDVAATWVVMIAGDIPAGRVKAALLERARAPFVRGFLRGFDLADVRRHLAAVVEWKTSDPNMTAGEKQIMRDLASRNLHD